MSSTSEGISACYTSQAPTFLNYGWTDVVMSQNFFWIWLYQLYEILRIRLIRKTVGSQRCHPRFVVSDFYPTVFQCVKIFYAIFTIHIFLNILLRVVLRHIIMFKIIIIKNIVLFVCFNQITMLNKLLFNHN